MTKATLPLFRHPQTRRALLRGSLSCLALPWLESISVFADEPKRSSALPAAPRRFGVLYMANGVHGGKDMLASPNASGGITFAPVFRPLQALAPHITVVEGLRNQHHKGSHDYSVPELLSGLPCGRGITVDQLLAKEIGDQTPLPSLVLGTEDVKASGKFYYGSLLSWAGPQVPMPKEIRPALAFDALYGRTVAGLASVLDDITADAHRLRGNIAKADARKLDQYLTSVRETERRIQRLRNLAPNETGAEQATMECPAEGIPISVTEHLQTMLAIMRLAFQTDKTRIISFMMNNDQSSLVFPGTGIKNIMHGASHGNGTSRVKADGSVENTGFCRIVSYHADLLAQFLKDLQAVQEGERTLLDNSMVLFTSNLWHGGQHSYHRLPMFVCGHGGGSIAGNQVIDCFHANGKARPACDLYVSLLQRMGLEINQFGDSTGQVTGL